MAAVLASGDWNGRLESLAGIATRFALLGPLDVVLCRNVIIYFDTHTAQGVLGRFLASLAPDPFASR